MPVTPSLSVHERLILADKALIQSLLPNQTLFPDLTAQWVLDQIIENQDVVQAPGVLVSCEGCKVTYEAIDEFNDAVMRQVLIAVVARNDPKYVAFRPKFMLWEQSLMKVFRLGPTQGLNPVLATVPEVSACWMDPQPVIDKTSKVYQNFRGGFLLKYRCIEPRGVAGQ